MPAKNGSPAASPRARSSRAGPVCQSWTWSTSSGTPSRRSAARAARQKTANRHGSSGMVVEARRGRRPRARRPAAAGSRPPRRRRSRTSRAPRRRRDPRSGAAARRRPAGDRHGPVARQEHVDRRRRAPCPPRAAGPAPGRARPRRRRARRSWPRARTRRRGARRASSSADRNAGASPTCPRRTGRPTSAAAAAGSRHGAGAPPG